MAGITDGGFGVAAVPAPATIALLATGGLLLGQLSYRGAGLAAPLAMVSVANPVIAATAGMLLLGEGFRFGSVGMVLAVVAALIAARGVVGLAACAAGETIPVPVADAVGAPVRPGATTTVVTSALGVPRVLEAAGR